MKENTLEKGQVLILIILAVAVIFGFAALAVDVGRLYSERRRAQSAADAAAYAAAFAASQGDAKTVYTQKGLDSAIRNGFVDDSAALELGDIVDVEVYNPPISGKYSIATSTIKPAEYYQVFITQQVDPVFSQFVYQGNWTVRVEAVVHSTAKRAFADGNVIVATCPNCCDAVDFSGNPYVYVVDGDIISNSVGSQIKNSCNSAERNGKGCVIVDNGGIILGGEWYPGDTTSCKDNNGNTISPPVQADDGIDEGPNEPWAGIDPGMPGCLREDGSSLPTVINNSYNNVGTEPGKPFILKPGIYSKGISISGQNSVVKLEPGMYCLDGDLEVKSGMLAGDGVMFVMRGNSSININTNQSVSLTAPGDEEQCIKDPKFYDTDENFCWSGFLVYMPYNNEGTVRLGGGNSTTYEGTIYAPGPAKNDGKKCIITGNSETMGINASIICHNVQIDGNGTINIKYYDKINAQQPALIELAK